MRWALVLSSLISVSAFAETPGGSDFEPETEDEGATEDDSGSADPEQEVPEEFESEDGDGSAYDNGGGFDVAAAVAVADRSRKVEFAKKSYRFCHDPAFEPRGRDVKLFCELAKSSTSACPQVRTLCRPPAHPEVIGPLPGWVSNGLLAGSFLIPLLFLLRGLRAASVAAVLLAVGSARAETPSEPDTEPSWLDSRLAEIRTFDHEPSGLSALPFVLMSSGIPTRTHHGRLDRIEDSTSVVVLRSSYLPAGPNFDDWLDQGLAVVILDDQGSAEKLLPVIEARVERTQRLEPAIGGFCGLDPEELVRLSGEVDGPVRDLVPRAGTRTSSVSKYPIELTPLLWVGENRTHMAALGAHRIGEEKQELPGCLFLVSSASLMANAAIARPQNARFAVAFFASLLAEGDEVVFLEPEPPTGLGWLAALTALGALPLALHVLLIAAMMVWAVGTRFGSPVPVPIAPNSSVANVEAVGRWFEQSGVKTRDAVLESFQPGNQKS